jgi:hypothetical protein
VRNPQARSDSLRKASWAAGGGEGNGDKENMALNESDEERDPERQLTIVQAASELSLADTESDAEESHRGDGDASDAETLRRSSRGSTNVTRTESYASSEYSDDDDVRSEWTESAVGPETNLGAQSVVSAGDEVVLYQA